MSLVDKPFWISNKTEHDYLAAKADAAGNKGLCCFNHIVGLPNKIGLGPCPLFDYEVDLFDRMMYRGQKRLVIKKATGLGITEFYLRLILWLCLRNNDLKGSQILILTGPRIDLAIGLIRRMKRILWQRLGVTEQFEFKQTYLELNGVEIEAYPSHTVNTIRALERPSFILLDEFDFFKYDPNDPDNPRAIAERYSLKSNPYMALISTPNLPGGLLEHIENDIKLRKAEVQNYELVELDYNVGLGKIYDDKLLDIARLDPSFQREYELKYGYGLGNCFSATYLNNALKRGLDEYSMRLYSLPGPEQGQRTYRSLAVDPGYSSSKFAILSTEWLPEPRLIRITEALEVESADFGDMLNQCVSRIRNYKPNKVFVDGSQVEFIRALKHIIGEDELGYEDEIHRLRQWNNSEIDVLNEFNDLIAPVMFGYHNMSMRMIEHARQWLERKDALVIERDLFPDLVSQLYMSKQKPNGSLDKTKHSLDLVDTFLMSLLYYKIQE